MCNLLRAGKGASAGQLKLVFERPPSVVSFTVSRLTWWRTVLIPQFLWPGWINRTAEIIVVPSVPTSSTQWPYMYSMVSGIAKFHFIFMGFIKWPSGCPDCIPFLVHVLAGRWFGGSSSSSPWKLPVIGPGKFPFFRPINRPIYIPRVFYLLSKIWLHWACASWSSSGDAMVAVNGILSAVRSSCNEWGQEGRKEWVGGVGVPLAIVLNYIVLNCVVPYLGLYLYCTLGCQLRRAMHLWSWTEMIRIIWQPSS